jgi:hypothetical protein
MSYRIADPGRFVDADGGLLVRFVSRSDESYETFSMAVRLAGVVR